MSDDPKLQEVMIEILRLIDENDLAGQVTLVSETHAKLMLRVDPSWSCASTSQDDTNLSISMDIDLDSELNVKLMNSSVHMLAEMRKCSWINYSLIDNFIKKMESEYDVKIPLVGSFMIRWNPSDFDA